MSLSMIVALYAVQDDIPWQYCMLLRTRSDSKPFIGCHEQCTIVTNSLLFGPRAQYMQQGLWLTYLDCYHQFVAVGMGWTLPYEQKLVLSGHGHSIASASEGGAARLQLTHTRTQAPVHGPQ